MSVMKQNTSFKPKAGYVYVVTNECLRLVKAKGVKSAHKNTGKAKAFSFAEVGIANDAKLVFVPTGAEVTVVGDKKIEYKGTQYSLSGFCKIFMPHKNSSGAYQGPKFFSYNGKTLLDIRKEIERN